jgi:hypothetical protein
MPSYTTTVRSNRMTQVLNAIDAGAGAGTVKVYSGTVPANVGTAITDQTLLATLTLSDPCGSVSNGVLTFSAITEDSSGDANGTPTFARLADSDGNNVAPVPHIRGDEPSSGFGRAADGSCSPHTWG